MNDCTFTRVVKKALRASFVPPSVKRKRVPLIVAPPFSVRVVAPAKPELKLTVGDGAGFTVSIAALLVTGPAALLTTT